MPPPALAQDGEMPGAVPLKVDPLFGFDSGPLIHHGGTINATDDTKPPASSGPGFGYWFRQRDGSCFVRFRFAQYAPDGNAIGFRVVSKTVTLVGADTQSAVIRSLALDASGQALGTRCAVEDATRFR